MDNALADVLAIDTLPDKVSRVIHRAEILVSAMEVDAAIDRLAVGLTALAQDRNPVLLTLLPGGGYLSGALLRRMIFPLQTSYVYWRQESGQPPQVTFAGGLPQLGGRLVILLDDGLTSSNELNALGKGLHEAGAAEGWRCSMVGPPETSQDTGAFFTRSLPAITADEQGMFGCGLDVYGYCRNLPGLYRI
jgi:hypoxanthine phosphoribosyltransferase